MTDISIIMPLYNAAKYLEETLRSVQKQTFRDFEVICVNDASTDDTMKILQNFQTEDSRIQIISNSLRYGAAYSRNRGMKAAKGKYLAFLDGDDIFEEEMFEKAYRAALENRADVVLYEYCHVASDVIYNKSKVFHSEQYMGRYCGKLFSIQDYAPYEWLNWGTSPCNKLYEREFIEHHRITFQDLSCFNDVYFVCMVMMLSKRSLILQDDRVMVYLRDHDEPTRISADRDPMCCYQAFLHMAEELQKRDLFPDLSPYFCYRFFSLIRSALRQCRTEEKERHFYQFLQEEGIETIRSMVGAYYDKLDIYIKTALEKFQKLEFDSKWYREEFGLQMQLDQKGNAEIVVDMFLKCKKNKQAIGIWGAGANGISLLNFCKEKHLEVNMVIDKSEEKQGCTVNGYVVKAPKDIYGNIQVLIVASRYILDSVRQELSGQNVEIIDINQLLYLY